MFKEIKSFPKPLDQRILSIGNMIRDKFFRKFNKEIDETQLHKLIFFSQIASYSLLGEKLFNEDFNAYEFGPVVHKFYVKIKTDPSSLKNAPLLKENIPNVICDFVVEKLGKMTSGEVSEYSHIDPERIRNKVNGSTVGKDMTIEKSIFMERIKNFFSPDDIDELTWSKESDEAYRDFLVNGLHVYS